MRRFKLDADAASGRWLARAMRLALQPRLVGAWSRVQFVAVPLHRSKRRRRGFDQAAWLAERLARRLGQAFVDGALLRVLPTRPQGDPLVRSRERNVEGAFTLRARARLSPRPVVLVDDVCTSGATARACAEVLRAAGVEHVALLTACRS